MNVLTKAFVVVVTVLSVILVTLVISFVARTENYAQKYDDLKLALEGQIQETSEVKAKAQADLAEKGEEIQSALDTITKINEELSRVKSDRTGLEARLDDAANTLARLTAALEVANRVNENKDAQIAASSKVIQDQIASIGEQQGQIADLTQTLINVRKDNRRLSDNYRRIQEENKSLAVQLDESQAKVEIFTKQLAALGQDVDKTLVPQPTGGKIIRGAVTKINQLNEGITFVQVNVGTRDEVQEGMQFTVYRGDRFVGKIQIASVDTAEAVGRVTTLVGDVQEGDAIRAGGR